jgi:alkyl hydroperoxide reductase 1
LVPVGVQYVTELAFSGAFTPSCSASHLPGYIQKLSEIKSKGVDIVAVIAYNDPYVMSAWGKANGVKENDIVSIRPS